MRSASLSIMKYGSMPIFFAVSTSPAHKVLRSHFRDRPAAWVTPITCQQPGTAQQKVCTRPRGSMDILLVCAYTTPLVPMVVKAAPSRTMPVPTAAAALSPAPPTTGVPARSPVAFATAEVMLPVISGDSYTFGNSPRSISSRSNNS